jgi:hypothetical protein
MNRNELIEAISTVTRWMRDRWHASSMPLVRDCVQA